MSIHACTKFQLASDHILLHTMQDGSVDDIKNELKLQRDYWQRFLENIQEDIVNSPYDFSSVIEWAKNLEVMLKVHDDFPSLETLAALTSMKSFTRHHVMPHYNNASKTLLDYWQYQHPQVVATPRAGSFHFSAPKKNMKIMPQAVDARQYKIVRIKAMNEMDQYMFIDIKVANFNRKEFLFNVLTLPEFWRNFHFVSRKKKENGASSHPAYDINKTLAAFYTPAKSFSISSSRGTNKQEIANNVKANMPLALQVNSFASHLFFSKPGIIVPLTAQEQAWSAQQKPELEIFINENDMHLICIGYSQDIEENKTVLEEFSEEFSAREQSFASFFELGQYFGGPYLLTTGHEFAFLYEGNMIELFDSLTKYDEQTN